MGAGKTVTLTVPGLPSGTKSVAFNVTATGPTASSFVTVFPGGQPRLDASNLNFVKDQTIANMVIVAVGSGGKVSFANTTGEVDIIADVAGYYTTP